MVHIRHMLKTCIRARTRVSDKSLGFALYRGSSIDGASSVHDLDLRRNGSRPCLDLYDLMHS